MKKQVDKSHYDFTNYISKQRWISMWHQLDEVISLNPSSVLEIGPGPGVFKSVAITLGLNVKSLDLDSGLNPDYVDNIESMSFGDAEFDVVCAFQVLEHLPFDKSLLAFAEIVRVAKRNIVISLPDSLRTWSYAFTIPRLGMKWFQLTRPGVRYRRHRFDGEHYWEINKLGYKYKTVLAQLLNGNRVELIKSYRVCEFSYHRFFVFKKYDEW